MLLFQCIVALLCAPFIYSNRGAFNLKTFFGKLETIEVKEHETANLPCSANRSVADEENLSWWKGNTMIADWRKTSSPKYSVNNLALEIANATASDDDQYYCRLLGPTPRKPVYLNTYRLHVLYPPKVNMTPTGYIEVELGNEVNISCTASGFPPPVISWFFKEEEITQLSSVNSLRFVAKKDDQSGEYWCHGTNSNGNRDSASVNIQVIYPPRVKVERPWVNFSPGMQAEVTCEITGIPQPEIEWLLDDVPVTYNRRVLKVGRTGYRRSLFIARANLADFGNYKCVASNKLGTAFGVVHLSATPSLPEFKNTLQEKFEDRVTLAWEVDSYSPINQYKLLFRKVKEVPDNWTALFVPGDSSSIGPIHTQMYTLTGLTPATQYEAVVVTKNRFGWSRPSSVFRFSTLGRDLGTTITTEGLRIETMTLNGLFPDLVVNTQGANYQPSSSRMLDSSQLITSIAIVYSLTQLLKHIRI